MARIVTRKVVTREDKDEWLMQLAQVITEPLALLQLLALDNEPELLTGIEAKQLFPMRVPRAFVQRMKVGDANDPLFKQVFPQSAEFIKKIGFSCDPLEEQKSVVPSLLHKYANRVLLLVKGGCAINCRYCFRRHFPYDKHQGNKHNWQAAIDYLRQHPEVNEVILSGGDPLMAKDHELKWLIEQLSTVAHLQRIRFHSRLPIMIPERITDSFCQLLEQSPLTTILVTHINHANEIDEHVQYHMHKLKKAGVTLLNQSVLLKGINDDATVLAALSNRLFACGILPYYLHVLDKVEGATHYWVSDEQARSIMHQLLALVSGFLVPKLTREIAGEPSKTVLDLYLKQN